MVSVFSFPFHSRERHVDRTQPKKCRKSALRLLAMLLIGDWNAQELKNWWKRKWVRQSEESSNSPKQKCCFSKVLKK